MDKTELSKIMNWLGYVLHCPICNVKYNAQGIKVLEMHREDDGGELHLLIHSDCRRCKSSVMFNIDIAGPDLFTATMAVTDLTSADSVKFGKVAPLSMNDVISVHQGLKLFNGDLVRVLK